MLLLPLAIFGLYAASRNGDVPGIAYFIALTSAVLLGVWDALND